LGFFECVMSQTPSLTQSILGLCAFSQSVPRSILCYPVFVMATSMFSQCLALIPILLRMESVTSCIQRIPSPSPSKAASKLKYSHMVESTLRPRDPGKLSPDLSRVRSCDISTTLGLCDIQTCDPGKVSHNLPRDWSSTQSQVAT